MSIFSGTSDAETSNLPWSATYLSMPWNLYLTLRHEVCSPSERDALRRYEHPRLNAGAEPTVLPRIVAKDGRVWFHPQLGAEIGTVIGSALARAANGPDSQLAAQASLALEEIRSIGQRLWKPSTTV